MLDSRLVRSQQVKAQGSGWYVRLSRQVIDERGQVVMPWMAPIASADGRDVVAMLPACEVPAEEKLQEGDCVRAVVLRTAPDLSSITLSLDATKLSRFQTDGEVHLRVGRINGLQGLGAPCGKYNIAIMSEPRLQREDSLSDLQRVLGLSGFESVWFGKEVKECLAKPLLDVAAMRKQQDAQSFVLNVLQGCTALQMSDVAVAQECFAEALRLDPTVRECHLGMARVYRMLKQEDKAAEHDRLANSSKSEPLQGFPMLKILFEPASSAAAIAAAKTVSKAAFGPAAGPAPAASQEESSAAKSGDEKEEKKLHCPVCDAEGHTSSDCPYLLCSKCRMWGHLAVYCEANQVQVPPSGVHPQSLLEWEKALAEVADVSSWQRASEEQSQLQAPQTGSKDLGRSRLSPRSEEKKRQRDSPTPAQPHYDHRQTRDRERDRGGDYRDGPDRGRGSNARMICHHCHQEGHWRPDCPQLRSSFSGGGASAAGTPGSGRRYDTNVGTSPDAVDDEYRNTTNNPNPNNNRQTYRSGAPRYEEDARGASGASAGRGRGSFGAGGASAGAGAVGGAAAAGRSVRRRSRSRSRSLGGRAARGRSRSPLPGGSGRRSPDHKAQRTDDAPAGGVEEPNFCLEFLQNRTCSTPNCTKPHIPLDSIINAMKIKK